MEAYIKDSVLDKILKTKDGILKITPEELDIIIASDIVKCNGGFEIMNNIFEGKDFTLFGVEISAEY